MNRHKVAITGHTKGIGKALFNHFLLHKKEVMGFSRSNGYDLETQLDKIIDAIEPAHILINNASFKFQETKLLYYLFERWKDQDKIIIHIGSETSDGVKDYIHPYSVVKAAADKACEQLQNVGARCRVINIRPGFVNTESVAQYEYPKLETSDIIQTVDWVLQQPEHVHIRNIALRHRGVDLCK